MPMSATNAAPGKLCCHARYPTGSPRPRPGTNSDTSLLSPRVRSFMNSRLVRGRRDGGMILIQPAA